MKKLQILTILALLTSTGFTQQLTDSIFKPETFIRDVSILAADSLEGRLTGRAGADRAALYISQRFAEIGLKPLNNNKGFSLPVENSLGNIVGTIPGKSRAGELVIFSAHYDHVGILHQGPEYMQIAAKPIKKADSIFNGANDNASGIALLLSLAAHLMKENQHERTIIFAAFTGEELGFVGSKEFAKNIADPKSVKAVINFDMVGIPRSKKAGAFVTGNETSGIINQLNKTLRSSSAIKPKPFFTSDPYPEEFLNTRSDHVPFANLGIYAVTISATSPYDKNYHTVNDEWQTLDYPFIKKMAAAVSMAVKPILIDATLK